MQKRLTMLRYLSLQNFRHGRTFKRNHTWRCDVVIDCVGMDGKKSPLEFLEQKLKLQGGTLGPIQIATKAVRKYGTVQMTGAFMVATIMPFHSVHFGLEILI